MVNHHSPIAIIEIDRQGQICSATCAAVEILPNISEMQLQDWLDLFAVNSLDALDGLTVMLNHRRYFCQTLINSSRLTIILQPLSYLRAKLARQSPPNQQAFAQIVAQSEVMQQLIAQAKAFSRQPEPLLISGATGTGKDVLALACHHYSQRGEQVFLALNCAALPIEVIESELYGYAPGAYPGATEGKKGFFEQANGGSVLLDGIDEMPASMQTKLLRFLNDGTFRRVGDDNEVKVDVRVICATKADLYSLVAQGSFRQDLYYRLNVLSLHVPTLQEREADIMPLTRLFVDEFAAQKGVGTINIASDVEPLLLQYSWPGNVRQLKNILSSALAQLLARQGSQLLAKDIVLPTEQPVGDELYALPKDWQHKRLDEMVKTFERTIIERLYNEYPSTRKLSKRLGISHTAIANKLKEYKINGKA